MEDKTCHPHSGHNDETEIVRSTRDLPPAHYIFRINNFSLLLEMEDEKCDSGQFEVGGYQWCNLRTLHQSSPSAFFSFHPSGKKNSNGNCHISVFLGIAGTNDLSLGWEVNVNIRFFVFDQIRDKYLSVQDANGRVRRFHNLKTEWGFVQLLSHETLNDPSNGYLVDDTCVFGVEVFVIKATCKGESLSMINEPQSNYFTWKIDNFTDLKDEEYYSEHFTVEGQSWKLNLYPKGHGTRLGTFLSLYLILDGSKSLPPNRKVYAKYKLWIRDQINSNHLEKTAEYWFSDNINGYGCIEFLALGDLRDTSKGYLVGDALFIECKIDVISVVEDFSSY